MAETKYQLAEDCCPEADESEHAQERHTQADGSTDVICLDHPFKEN